MYFERVFLEANAVDACYQKELDDLCFLEGGVCAVLGYGAEALG